MRNPRISQRLNPEEDVDSGSADERPEPHNQSNSHRRRHDTRRSANPPAPKRRRVSRACDQCRGRKDKCDGRQPSCLTCIALKQQCTYGSTPKRRGLPTGYVRRLELILSLIFSKIEASENAVLSLLSDTFENVEPGKNLTTEGLENLLRVWTKGPVMHDVERFIPQLEALEEARPRRATEGNDAEVPDFDEPPPSAQFVKEYRLLPLTEPFDDDDGLQIASEPDAEPEPMPDQDIELNDAPEPGPEPEPEPDRVEEARHQPFEAGDLQFRLDELVMPEQPGLFNAMAQQPDPAIATNAAADFPKFERQAPKVQPYLGLTSGITSGKHQDQFWQGSCLSARFGFSLTADLHLPIGFRFLMDIYFAKTHSWLPFLDRAELFRLTYRYASTKLPIKQCRQEGGMHSVLWAVLALAAVQEPAFADTGRTSQRSPNFADKMYFIARSLLPSDESEFDINHVQALLVLSLLNLGKGLWSSAWLLIGQASRLAIHFGLPSGETIRLHDDFSSTRNTLSAASSLKSKRVFHACFALETLLSARLGRPPYLRSAFASHLGPLDEDGLEEWDPWTDVSARQMHDGPSHILSIFNQFLGLMTILNDALGTPAYEVSADDVESLLQRLKTWQTSLPQHCCLDRSFFGEGEISAYLEPSPPRNPSTSRNMPASQGAHANAGSLGELLPHLTTLHLTCLSIFGLLERRFASSSLLSADLKERLLQGAERASSGVRKILSAYPRSYLAGAPAIVEYYAWLACRMDVPLASDELCDRRSQLQKHLGVVAETWFAARSTAEMISPTEKLPPEIDVPDGTISAMPPPSAMPSLLGMPSGRPRATSRPSSTSFMPMNPTPVGSQQPSSFQPMSVDAHSSFSGGNTGSFMDMSAGSVGHGTFLTQSSNAVAPPSVVEFGLPSSTANVDSGVDALLDEFASLEGLDWAENDPVFLQNLGFGPGMVMTGLSPLNTDFYSSLPAPDLSGAGSASFLPLATASGTTGVPPATGLSEGRASRGTQVRNNRSSSDLGSSVVPDIYVPW